MDLYFDDFIEEDLRVLLKLKLEVLRWKRKQRSISVSQQCTVLYASAECDSQCPDLVVKGAVGGFLRLRVFLLVPHTDENCGVDVHADQLPSLQDVHTHL